MKNFFFTLVSLLLFTTVEGNAQVTVSTSDEFSNALTELSNLSTYQTNLATAQENAALYKGYRDKYEPTTTTTVTTYNQLSLDCYNAYNAIAKDETYKTENVWLYERTETDYEAVSQRAFKNWLSDNEDGTIEEYAAAYPDEVTSSTTTTYEIYPIQPSLMGVTDASGAIQVTIKKLWMYIDADVFTFTLKCFYVDSSVDGTTYTCVDSSSALTKTFDQDSTRKDYATWFATLASTELAVYKASKTEEEQEVANSTWVNYNTQYTAYLAEAAEWQAKIDAAEKNEIINLGASFSTSEYISSFSTTLNGNGYTITLSNTENGSLIKTLSGTVTALGIKGGKIAYTNNGTIGKMCYYIDASGVGYANSTANGTFAQFASITDGYFAYSLRENFGMDMNNTSAGLVPVTNNTKVYKCKYTPNGSESHTAQVLYLNNVDGKMSGTQRPILANNEFIYLTHSNTGTAITEANIVDNGTCNNCVLTDKSTLYIPENFTATKLSYDRSFSTTKWATACLPFTLTKENISSLGIEYLERFYSYDASSRKLTFAHSGYLTANVPCLIAADGAVFNDLELSGGVEVSATPSSLNDGEYYFGTYEQRYGGELDEAGTYWIFGFVNNEIKTAGTTSYFDAFRAYIKVPKAGYGEESAKSLTLIHVDEDGNEISSSATGIADNEVVASSVKAGDKCIVIVSDIDKTVKVYSVNGKLVKTVFASAGTTTIPVESGAYIVDNVKLIVK